MAVLPLILKVDLYVFRKGLEIPVIPDKANLIYKDKSVGREGHLSKVFRLKLITAGEFPVKIYLPAKVVFPAPFFPKTM
jgi:hypothetical protein